MPVKSVRHQPQGNDIDSEFEMAEKRDRLSKNEDASGDVQENKGERKKDVRYQVSAECWGARC